MTPYLTNCLMFILSFFLEGLLFLMILYSLAMTYAVFNPEIQGYEFNLVLKKQQKN